MESDSVAIRSCTLGELVDRSIRFWRRHLRTLLPFIMGIGLVMHVFEKLPQVLAALRGEPDSGAAGAGFASTSEWLLSLLTQALARMPMTWMLGTAAAAMLSVYTYHSVMGQPVTLRAAWCQVANKFGAVMVALLLALTPVLAAVLLPFMLAGGLSAITSLTGTERSWAIGFSLLLLVTLLGGYFGLVWLILRYALLLPAALLESKGLLAALRRSRELMTGRVKNGIRGVVRTRALCLLAIICLILVSSTLLGLVPQLLLGAVYSVEAHEFYRMKELAPPYLLLPAEWFGVLVGALSSPLPPILATLFYLDVRVRREGVDLELQTTSGAKSPSPAPRSHPLRKG